MGLETMQLSLHGAASYGSVYSWESLHYILTVFLCYPMCFLCTKMLTEPDKARTSPVKLTGSLQALNLGIAVPLSLGS